MACIYKINNVELSEEQFHGLVKRALSIINEKKNNSPEQIHTAQVFNMISELGINDINTESIKKIEQLNDKLGREYQTDDDFISINQNSEIVINTDLISNINKEIESLSEPDSNKIESVMNDIMFSQANELTGFSADPVTINKFVNVINYKKSLIKRLKVQLSQVTASKSNFDSKSEEYADLVKLEREIKERLNGKGHKEQSFYVQGLIREVAKLNKEDNIDQLFSYLNSDINRLKVLSERSDISSIYEAKEILKFFDAIHNTNKSGIESNINPIFDMAGLQNGDIETIKKFKNLAYNVIETFEEKIQLNEKKILEEIIKKDPDLKAIFKDDELKYEKFFNSGGVKGLMMKDISWYDAFMMDGTMGTFSDFGHIPQISKKILEEKMRKFVAKEANWNERMNNILPNVTSKLQELGYGINILGAKVGASYDIFRQKYINGDKTNRLIDRVSAEFIDELRKMNNNFFSEIERARRSSEKSTSYILEENAYKKRNTWNRLNRIAVDPRKITSIINNPEFSEFNSEFINDNGSHEAELKKHLQSDNGYNEIIADQEEKIRRYISEKSRYANDLLKEYQVTKLSDLDYEATNEFAKWQIENNPFTSVKYYEDNVIPKYKGIVVYPKMTTFNNFIARRYTVESKIINSKSVLTETGTQTGYYDKNFETIEKNPVLYEFHKLASEILTESRKHLPLEQQREMNYNVIAGKSKSFIDIIADPNLAFARKFSDVLRNIHDKIINSFTVRIQSINNNNSLIDTITGQKQSEVSLKFIDTNGVEIKRNFEIQSIKFIQTLNKLNKRLFLTENGKYQLRKNSKISFDLLSSRSKEMIAEMLDTSPTENNLRKVLNVEKDNMVHIGRIIERSVISSIVENETYNLPQILKLYMHGSMEYAGKNAAMPVISMIKNHYQNILKPNQNNTGKTELSVASTKREWANSLYERWYQKNVLGNLQPTVYGAIEQKIFSKLKERNTEDGQRIWQADYTLSSLTHDERIIHEAIQDIINKELNLPPEERNNATIDDLRNMQNQIGKNFAASTLIDRLLDLTRVVSLGLNPASATTNYIAGKISNYLAATSELYFSSDSFFKAENLVMNSHLKMCSAGIISTPNAKKIALLVERFKIFQDSSDEVYKSSINTALKGSSMMNLYFLSQRTEYVNQAPILIAMLIDQKIKGKDGTETSVWDALDENGKLLDNYATDENKNTWEYVSDDKVNTFVTKVNSTISNVHGDYSTLGGSNYSNEQLFRATMMFKRWMSRYIHTRYSIEYDDHSLGRKMKGRYRSLSAASGTAIISIIGVTLAGLNPFVLGGAVAAGTAIGLYNNLTKDNDVNYLKELGLNLLQIGSATLLTTPRIVGGLVMKKNIFSKTMLDDFIYNGHRSNELDNGNMKANIAEAGLIVNVLLLRLMLKAILSNRDEDEENGMLNLAINMCAKVLNDMTMFQDPSAMYDGFFSQLSIFRLANNFIKLGDTVIQALAGDDIYTTGINAGDSKVEKAIQKAIYPSMFRDGFGFQKDMEQVNSYYGEFGFDKLMDSDDDKMETVIRNARSKFKAEVSNKMKENITQEQINNIALQLRQQNPDLSESAAKKKAEKLIEKSIKNEAEKIANKVVPTLNARKKRNPKITLKEINDQIDNIKQ